MVHCLLPPLKFLVHQQARDVGGDRLQVKTDASQQILDLGCYNFLPVAPITGKKSH